MAYTAPPHTAKQIINAFAVEATYATYVAPTFSFGTGCAITNHSKNNPENQQPIAKETNFKELPVTLTKEHTGTGKFNLCYAKPLQFIGSGVYNRRPLGAGDNYNHIVNFLSKTINTCSMNIARRHTTPLTTKITSAYWKSLNITGAVGEIVKCSFDYTAYDADDVATVPTVTETTYTETLMAKSPVTFEGSAVGYIPNIDFRITKNQDETRDIATTAEYSQTEPALMDYDVEGTLTIKLFDKTYWDYFQGETLKVSAIADINRFNIAFTKSATDKIVFTFGDLYIPENEIPSPSDGILTQNFNFSAYKQKTMISSSATSTSANKLVDTNLTFTDGIEGAFIHNTTDDTWGVVTDYEGANTLYLSTDIMASGEGYDIFNPAIRILSVDQLATH